MKRAFLFVGQGQQYPGMGVDLSHKFPYVKAIYNRAHDILGFDLLSLNAEDLMESEQIQTSLYVLGVALDHVLKHHDIRPDVVAGLSLGEYNALTSAGVIDFEDGLKIIHKRAKIMASAFENGATKMAAVLKTETHILESLLEGSGVEICNYNSPTNHVIGGYHDAMDRMLSKLKQEKVMAIPLKMASVSHMSLLNDASLRLHEVLREYQFKQPLVPFINNTHVLFQESDFINTLTIQIASPTHMGNLIKRLASEGVEEFVEVGPKGALTRLVKEVCGEDVKVKNVYDLESLEGYLHG